MREILQTGPDPRPLIARDEHDCDEWPFRGLAWPRQARRVPGEECNEERVADARKKQRPRRKPKNEDRNSAAHLESADRKRPKLFGSDE